MEEEFREIEGFPNYEVSNTGKIRNKISNKFLKPKQDKNGYFNLHLCRKEDGVFCRKDFRVHRLVALAFIPNPDGKAIVDHKDGNVINNNVDNLRWATVKENCWNTKKYRISKSGVKGIAFERNKYRVRIHVGGKYLNLGSFKTLEEAIQVRLDYIQRVREEFAHPDEGKVIVL